MAVDPLVAFLDDRFRSARAYAYELLESGRPLTTRDRAELDLALRDMAESRQVRQAVQETDR
jgi:hypothetical protein